MRPEIAAYLARLKTSVYRVRDLSGTSRWMKENLGHPKKSGEPWSFEHHEYQETIVNDGRHKVCGRKCSQIGFSELSIAVALAMSMLFENFTTIYTLPTFSFAKKFAKGRIDPAIARSKTVRASVPRDNNSSELKQIGTSMLYISGAFGQNSAISVPADAVVNDEVDFSDQTVLTTFASRLRHAQDGGYHRKFSTPTVDGYGVSKDFEASTQAYFAVKHWKCGNWVVPDPMSDLIIPGLDGGLLVLDKNDLLRGSVKVDEAFLRCPHCGHPVTHANLCDVSARQWVEKYPDSNREWAGYQIYPYDVPTINPISKTLREVANYKRIADYYNFCWGLTYQDSENSVLASKLDDLKIPWVRPRQLAAMGTVAGLDVGRTCWLTIGKRSSPLQMDVIHQERISARVVGGKDSNIIETVKQRFWEYGVGKLVVDAQPDFSTALGLIAALPHGSTYACYYQDRPPSRIANYTVKDAECVITAFRTGVIDDMVKTVNRGSMRMADSPEFEVVKQHLGNIKKVPRDADSEGVAEEQEKSTDMAWVKTGDDHYAHSLTYLMLADSMMDYVNLAGGAPALPSVGRVRMK